MADVFQVGDEIKATLKSGDGRDLPIEGKIVMLNEAGAVVATQLGVQMSVPRDALRHAA